MIVISNMSVEQPSMWSITTEKVKRHGKKPQNLSRDTSGNPMSGNWTPEVEENYLFLLKLLIIIIIIII